MGDFVLLFNSLNLSPVNTILLVALFWLVKSQFDRLLRVERRNRKQDRAISRLEEKVGLVPIPDDEDA